jgi:hypothetical protein
MMVTRCISLLTIVALMTAAAAIGQQRRQRALEEEAGVLICQAEKTARKIHYNTEQLVSLNHGNQVSQRSHYHHLEQIKSLINDSLGPSLSRLTEIAQALPRWQQAAIKQMLTTARALVEDTNAAMVAKKEAGSIPTVLNDRYHETVARMNFYAYVLVKTSDAAGDISSAHRKGEEAGLTVLEK